MQGKVKTSGILYGKNNGMILYIFQGGLSVLIVCGFNGDLFIVKETVGCLDVTTVAECRRYGFFRVLNEFCNLRKADAG